MVGWRRCLWLEGSIAAEFAEGSVRSFVVEEREGVEPAIEGEVVAEGIRFPRRGRFFPALHHRNFRIFFFGQGVSLIGTWMQTVAQAWLVLTLTNSPFLLGVVNALQFAPVMLFSLFGGAVADRLPKRTLIFTTQTVLMALALLLSLLTWTGLVRYWHVAVLATLLGIVNSFDMPARQSFLVELVGRRDLMNAIALNSANFNAARIIGPAIAGFVIARFGLAPAFFLNGLSFLAVLWALLQIEPLPIDPSPPGNLLREIKEGLRYIVRTPAVLTALALLGAVSTAVLNFNVLMPVLARSVLRGDARSYGLLMAAMGVGAFTGALVLAGASRLGPRWELRYGGAAAVSLAVLGMGFVGDLRLAAGLAGVAGFSMIAFTATTNTSVQVLVPDNLRGRVMSVYTLLFAGSTPAGALLTGGVMDLWGPRAGFFVAGFLGILAVVAIGLWARRLSRKGSSS